MHVAALGEAVGEEDDAAVKGAAVGVGEETLLEVSGNGGHMAGLEDVGAGGAGGGEQVGVEGAAGNGAGRGAVGTGGERACDAAGSGVGFDTGDGRAGVSVEGVEDAEAGEEGAGVDAEKLAADFFAGEGFAFAEGDAQALPGQQDGGGGAGGAAADDHDVPRIAHRAIICRSFRRPG